MPKPLKLIVKSDKIADLLDDPGRITESTKVKPEEAKKAVPAPKPVSTKPAIGSKKPVTVVKATPKGTPTKGQIA